VSGELNTLQALHLIYIDTKESMQRVTNHVLINTKSFYTHILMMKMFFYVSVKFFFLKKKRFFLKILMSNVFLNNFENFDSNLYKYLYFKTLKTVLKKKLIDKMLCINIRYMDK
jgi:hypothetical protein